MREFLLAVEMKEQPVNPQLGEGVEFSISEQAPSDFHGLLRFLVGVRYLPDIPGEASNANRIKRYLAIAILHIA